MDIKCERCGTEYEFDDSRVTEEGVTVKCSTCGHLFKVRKKSFVLTEPVPREGALDDQDPDRNWMVRRPDGTVLSFKELTTLQKWIVERRVSRDDEISKSGETWKRLGSIAELASFFQVVDQATASNIPAVSLPPVAPGPGSTQPLPAAAPAGTPMPQPIQAQVPTAAPGMTPVPPAPVQPQVGMGSPDMTPVPPAPAMGQASLPPPSEPVLPAVGPGALGTGAPVVPAPAEPDSWGDGNGYGTHDDDVVEKWKKRGRRKWFVIVPLVLILVGVGVFYLVAPKRFLTILNQVIGKTETVIPETALNQYRTGLKHFLLDSETELSAAIADLDGAVRQANGQYPQAMGMLAEACITRAERTAENIAASEAEIEQLAKKVAELRPADGKEPDKKTQEAILPLHNRKVELQTQLNVLNARAKKDMEEAKRQIDAAQTVDPKALAPKLALANYLRVQGSGRTQVESRLQEVAQLKPADPGLLFLQGITLAKDPALLEGATSKLNQAIEMQAKGGLPDMLRARYALARVLVQQKKIDDAKGQLEHILKISPGHAAAKSLHASLATPVPEEKPEEKPEEQPDKPKDPAKPADFDGWVTQADRLQRAGRSRPALKAFDEALALKPGHVEALTGKGLCLLDLGNNGGAVAAFRRALKGNPRYGDAIIGLAEAYKYKRDNVNAVKYYKRYLEMHPNGPEASVARSNLEQLK